jgi:hypothetical protein
MPPNEHRLSDCKYFSPTHPPRAEVFQSCAHRLLRFCDTDRDQFVRSLVYVYAKEPQIGQVTQAQVIEGKQRLNAITILLSAIFRHIATLEGPADEATRLRIRYIFNTAEAGENRYEPVLTRTDRETFEAAA